MFRDPRPFPEWASEPHDSPSPRSARPRFRWTRRYLLSVIFLALFLLSGLIGGWSVTHAIFGTQAVSAPPKMTLKQFLQQGNPYHAFTGPHVLPHGSQALSFWKTSSKTTQPLPSAEPPTIATVSQALSSAFLSAPTGSTSVAPVHLVGSDAQGTRIEVIIPPGALNLSKATAAGAAPQGTLTLTLTELHGQFAASTHMLGAFQLQITDVQHHVLQGVQLNNPMTFVYHYRPNELSDLDLDPSNLFLIWTDRIAAQTAAKQPTTGDVIPMQNDATNSTLTAQSSVIDAGTIMMAASTPENLSPPTPLLASESGNSGQVSFTYPLTVAPGPQATTPSLQVVYSSGDTNARHAANSPANSVGEGWSLSLGSITATKYSNGTVVYAISDVDHISDRLIPDSSGTNFQTEHISYMKITQVTVNGQPCFHVWDADGNYYEFGCTSDSLEYYINSSGTRTNYAWNLDKFIPANEGPGTASRSMTVSYVQDIEQISGKNSIRDAAIKQIVYGASQTAGTVDFYYKGPSANSPWITAYGNNEGGCKPPDGLTTTQRCDDPVDKSGGLNDPLVMSTLSLQTVKTYVGTDSSGHLDYSYSFSYQDTPFYDCTDPATLSAEYCAGNHLLQSITPTVYQNGTGHQLPAITFTYSSNGYQNSYTDTTQTVGGSAFKATTSWRFLVAYHDHSDGVGETFQYYTAWNNSNGTPITPSGDNRYDALFCDWNASDCQQSPFAPTNQKMWTVQVVTAITSSGKDSSSSSLSPATTSYDYWLQKTNGTCAADSSGDTDCVGFGYIPNGNSGWADYYDGEFRGFGTVLITSPSGDLTVQKYASTEGWQSPSTDAANYTAGQLYETDVYSGQYVNGSKLIEQTDYTYAGTNSTHTSCSSTFTTVSYTACEIVLLSKKTTDYEQTGSGNTNAPWTQQAYTYDDYNSSSGLGDYHQSPATGSYHNLQQEVITSSNAPTETEQWTYYTTNTTVNGTVYYDVNKVAHSAIVDASNHTWQCADYSYDAGVASGVPSPAAGWVSTTTSYSTCGNSSTAIRSYTGYDSNGNTVATVDGLGAANPSLYSNEGCTLSTAPMFFPTGSWSGTTYTTCAAFDPTSGLPTDSWNVFKQHTSTSYDATQGLLPTSATDVNSQVTSKAYSYDSNGNETVSVTDPTESASYTSQSTMVSTCTDSSTLPCLQIDSNASLYPNAVTRTFYDSQGRAVETLTPGPDSTHTTVQFTVYNDQTHSVFKSVSFVVNNTTSWVDPNGAVDDQGNTPGGTATTLDPLGSTLTVTDPAGDVTTTVYGVNTSGVSGDNNSYTTTTVIDANNHVQVSYDDALGRTIYDVTDSGKNGGTLTPVQRVTSQYNVLDKPTSVTVTDLAPQSGQSITSVTTTATYDDLGRMLTLTDPDRGTHTYTYDADGQTINDVSGTRTIGYNYDLLGRLGCTNDATTVINATGACTSGSHPYVQNIYDTNELGTQGTSDFPIGHLTQSIATTYFPEGTSATTTEQMQYDTRGRETMQTLQIVTPSAWNVTTALPTYQMTQSYNDANQAVTMQTSMGSSSGYTLTNIYDSTTGTPTGLSNQAGATSANLVTASYDNHAQLSTLNLLASDSSALASDQFTYDSNLRPIGTTALWQSGSGQSGTIFSQTTSYDAVSNVISQATNQAAVNGVSGSGGSEVENFCYNEQNELVWAGNGGTEPAAGNGTCGSGTLANSISGASYSASYVYTNLGQLWQGPLNGSGSYQYLYCNSQPHQLSGLFAPSSTCGSQSGQVYGGSYDAWGNETGRSYNSTTAALSYDLLDHLVEWNAGSNSQEWTVYDASGNRVLTRTTGSSGTTMTSYPFGTEEHQYDSNGNPIGNSTYYYTFAGELIGILLGTAMEFVLTDDLGSVRAAITNQAGSATVAGYMGYGPFGFLQYSAGQTGTNKGYTGQYNDSLSGLDYYNARYYDPIVGVFLSADTVQGNAQGMNPYAYVSGNPETFTDPTGLYFAGPSGQTYYTGAPYYMQGGEAYSISTGQSYTGNGFTNGWLPGYGANAPKPAPQPAPQKNVPPVQHSSNSSGNSNSILNKLVQGFQRLGQSLSNFWRTLTGPMSPGDANNPFGLPNTCGALSFAPMTKVATSQGEKAIGSLHLGEHVWAYNSKTHKMELEPVVHVWINHDNDLVDVTITSTIPAPHGKAAQKTSEVVHTNKRHPFLTVEKGFVPVSQLLVGMHVMKATGGVGIITMLKVIPGTMTMYNLEVAQDHTFTVGKGEWIVHNCGVGPIGSDGDSTDNITMQDLLNNPQLLKNLSPQQVEQIAAKDSGWVMGPLRKSTLPGETFNQLNPRGTAFTDKYIQWHAGGGRHGPQPYWKVSTNKGTDRVNYEGPNTTGGETTGGETTGGETTGGDIPDPIDP